MSAADHGASDSRRIRARLTFDREPARNSTVEWRSRQVTDQAPENETAAAVLSPHFDDAVLSCWHLLRGPGPVVIVNVFAGAPPQGSPPGWWDRRTGAVDARRRVGERAAEDRAALLLAGRTPINLHFLEAQHRGRAPTVAELTLRISRAVSGCHVLYAPAGIGAHPDHLLLRAAALGGIVDGGPVRLYADLPHAIGRGWPTWVAPDGEAVVDAAWAAQLAELRAQGLRPHVHTLDEAEQERKIAAVRTYGTQMTGLRDMAFGPLEHVLGYEVTWDVTSAEASISRSEA